MFSIAKKTLFVHILFIIVKFAVADAHLTSPFPSKVKNLCIPNAGYVDRVDYSEYSKHKDKGTTPDYYIYRSMAPHNEEMVKKVIDFGIKKVIIFKTQKKTEVSDEIVLLQNKGLKKSDITHIEFPYRDIHDFKKACNQTIDALKILQDSKNKKIKTLFHCTVGEDRTGYLSGLFRLLNEKYKYPQEIFRTEMCYNGFGAGNPDKPFDKVVLPIRETLTPLFIKMAYLIRTKKLTVDNINNSVCNKDPKYVLTKVPGYNRKLYECKNRPIKNWQCL